MEKKKKAFQSDKNNYVGRENMCWKNGEILVINKEKCIEEVTGYKIYLDIDKIEKYCLYLL